MYKTEIICENCDEHFAIVSISEKDPEYCPFCGAYIDHIQDEED